MYISGVWFDVGTDDAYIIIIIISKNLQTMQAIVDLNPFEALEALVQQKQTTNKTKTKTKQNENNS